MPENPEESQVKLAGTTSATRSDLPEDTMVVVSMSRGATHVIIGTLSQVRKVLKDVICCPDIRHRKECCPDDECCDPKKPKRKKPRKKK